MTTRSLLAALFVALCLALSGLVLHRQIAAHPAPDIRQDAGSGGEQFPPDFLGPDGDKLLWHTADRAESKPVLAAIQGQLDAFRAGNARQAMQYQSEGLRRNFPSPEAFLAMIRSHYPEFGQCRSAEFGPVLMDTARQHAYVLVIVEGKDGFQAQGYYFLLREGGVYRVAGVQGGERVTR